MDSISFNEIPLNIRVPYVYTEYDSTRANQGPGIQPFKALMMGQRLSSGSVAELEPKRVTSVAQAKNYFGAGSSLHRMAMAWFAENTFTELWMVAFDEPSAGTKATHTITFTGTATESGVLSLYIAGVRVQVSITTGDDATDMAAAAVSAINANTDLPVTAANSSGVVTLTAREKGLLGNMLDVRANYYEGEVTPAGVGVAFAAGTAGAGAVDLTDLWAVLGDEHYNVMVMPWNDPATLAALSDETESRAGPLRQIETVAFSAKDDTHSNLGTFGNARNDKFLTVIGVYKSPTPSYEIAASYAAVGAYYLAIDQARPLQTLELSHVLAPALADRFTQQENNLLLFDGIATVYFDAQSNVRLQRTITTYQENALGADDPAYLDVETLFTLSYIRWSVRTRILLKFPRHKLANDGTRFGSGQAVVTPKIMKAELVSLFEEWENLALVENADQFQKDLIVIRNASDPNRLDVRLPPDLVNQLRVTAIQIQFLV